jgi:hypothetical protein
MAEDAAQKVKQGHKELKLKVGLKLEQDIAMVKAVRRRREARTRRRTRQQEKSDCARSDVSHIPMGA